MAEMKILLVCAGGMSTSILMNKMKKYWASIEVPLDVEAVGLAEYNEHYQDFDVILIGPQVSYRQSMIEKETGKPCAAINSTDYALGNCDRIYEQVKTLYEEMENA
ncbi:PTS sugar transporter subunit IIB [Ileibacterium valens]|nr:PTS sugar transporter subunit IIB [Ileibacterium valens]